MVTQCFADSSTASLLQWPSSQLGNLYECNPTRVVWLWLQQQQLQLLQSWLVIVNRQEQQQHYTA